MLHKPRVRLGLALLCDQPRDDQREDYNDGGRRRGDYSLRKSAARRSKAWLAAMNSRSSGERSSYSAAFHNSRPPQSSARFRPPSCHCAAAADSPNGGGESPCVARQDTPVRADLAASRPAHESRTPRGPFPAACVGREAGQSPSSLLCSARRCDRPHRLGCGRWPAHG